MRDLTEETEFFDEFELDQEAIDAAHSAASWLLDGNSSFLDAHRIYQGIEDGDPAVLDTFPNPLSAEWGGESLSEIMDRVVAGGRWSELSEDVRDEMCERFESQFSEAYQDAARDEALTFMDRHTPETISESDLVYARFPGRAPYEAERATVRAIFDWAEEGITKLGQSEQDMPTIDLERDPYCDDSCTLHATSDTYCVEEYPQFLVRCATTSRGQFCVWMEEPS